MEEAAADGSLSAASGGDKATIAKLSAQLKRLTDANAKYKNLLKLAKDRIEKQEKETIALQQDMATLAERLLVDEKEAAKHIALDEVSMDKVTTDGESVIVRVCQRLKDRISGRVDDIWALMEMQVVTEDGGILHSANTSHNRTYKEWMRFDTELQLQDFIRRDTGEPLTLPPYALSPEQSARIQIEADSQVSKITEEFRRFRVRSELARTQADAQIRDLQTNNVKKVAQRIEGRDNNTRMELEQTRSVMNQMERLKAEMSAEEAHWKESYDALLTENNALKSAGSEALLAAQWRQRYENCLKEKEDLKSRLKMDSSSNGNGDGMYEVKYRDLKGMKKPIGARCCNFLT